MSVKVIETLGPSILHSTVTFPIAGAVLSTSRDKLPPVEYNENLTLAMNHFVDIALGLLGSIKPQQTLSNSTSADFEANINEMCAD